MGEKRKETDLREDKSKGLRDKSQKARASEGGGFIHHADTCLQVIDG